MAPEAVAHKFKKKAIELGYGSNMKGILYWADELEQWVCLHLGHLESKFR
mgnify:FL=1